MERIWGPVNGFYLAAYAAPSVDGQRFCSYAKVCWSRPPSYWEADCVFKVFGGEYHRDPERALQAVIDEARCEIECLSAQAKSLADQQRRDRKPLPRLFLTTFFRHRMA